jgi:amidase
MRKILAVVLFVLGMLGMNEAGAAPPQGTGAGASGGLSGRWLVKADFYGTPLYFQLELKEEGGQLTGKFGGDKLDGTVMGNSIHFVGKDEHGGPDECTATVKDGVISGTFVFKDPDDPEHPSTHSFVATLAPQRWVGAPQRREFTPTVFYRQFSAANKPVLAVSPGDTVHTTTVDAGGTDEKA